MQVTGQAVARQAGASAQSSAPAGASYGCKPRKVADFPGTHFRPRRRNCDSSCRQRLYLGHSVPPSVNEDWYGIVKAVKDDRLSHFGENLSAFRCRAAAVAPDAYNPK